VGLLAVHRLARMPAPGVLGDPHGQALARPGVTDTAHYLIRPDGHIVYRNAGTDPGGVERYLARWLPGIQDVTADGSRITASRDEPRRGWR
jgi:hypothetical protein